MSESTQQGQTDKVAQANLSAPVNQQAQAPVSFSPTAPSQVPSAAPVNPTPSTVPEQQASQPSFVPTSAQPPQSPQPYHAQPLPPPGPDSVISARFLSKWYGQVIGLNNLNLEVSEGITGIVGPNGAGKSTLFKLMMGMIRPSTGELYVLGEKPWKNIPLLGRIGFCPDYESLSPEMTGFEYLRLLGRLQAMPKGKLFGRIAEISKIVGMAGSIERKIGGYSKGMKQRMKIAGSLLHNPELLLLDEPLSGTDPLVRRDIIDLIMDLHKKHGHRVIVSSHVLHEVERMTHEVALIYKGRAVATGNISEIRGLIDKNPHNIVLEGEGVDALAKRLFDEDYFVAVRRNENKRSVTLQVLRPGEFFDAMPGLIEEVGCEIEKMYSLDDNLEAVFRYLVGW